MVSRKTVMILIKGDQIEAFGSLTKLCRAKGFTYNTIKMHQTPFEHKGWLINRVNFNCFGDEKK